MVTLTCFFEQNTDLGQIYVDQDDIEARVLDGTIDPAYLSKEGHEALTKNTLWVMGDQGDTGWGDSCRYATSTCSPRIGPEQNNSWAKVAAGACHVNIIKTDGTLWAWGQNNCGQLGTSNVINTSSPVQEFCSASNWDCIISLAFNTSALKADGSLWLWGAGTGGRLANNSQTSVSKPTREVTSSTWMSIGANAGGQANFGVKTNGTLWTWGCNGSYGNMAINCSTGTCRLTPVQVSSTSSNWCFVSLARINASSAIKTDGTLWAWGQGDNGAIGDNNNINRSSPVQEVTNGTDWCYSAGGNGTTIALKNDGSFWGWGINGTRFVVGAAPQTTCFSSPVQEFSQSYGWCKADACYHNMALKVDGTLWGWTNFQLRGELGDAMSGGGCSPTQEYHSLTTWCDISVRAWATFAIKG